MSVKARKLMKRMYKQGHLKRRKIGKVSYVSIFSTPEQERLFAKSARETMSKEAKLKW